MELDKCSCCCGDEEVGERGGGGCWCYYFYKGGEGGVGLEEDGECGEGCVEEVFLCLDLG